MHSLKNFAYRERTDNLDGFPSVEGNILVQDVRHILRARGHESQASD
jgi:hypothetical protein